MIAVKRPRIKVCGLTRLEDASLAVELGAWALGFVFHPTSPRAVSPETVTGILSSLSGVTVKKVGVFVDFTADAIVEIVRRSGLDTVQLHGAETPEFARSLSTRLTGVNLIKALRPRTEQDLALVPQFGECCEAILLDAYVEGVQGGTGKSGDWALAQRAARGARVILAGGLGPANIEAALRVPGIYAVDASSGLEESPGRKSSQKLKAFFENAEKVEL